jgi:hypothetical protein
MVMVFVFLDKMLSSRLKINRRFGGKCFFHLNISGESQARNLHDAGSKENDGEDLFIRNSCLLSIDFAELFLQTQNSAG